METTAVGNGDIVSAPLLIASKKLVTNCVKRFRRKVRKLQEAELANEQTSAVTPSEEVRKDLKPHLEPTVVVSDTKDQDDTLPAAIEATTSELVDHIATNSTQNSGNKKSKAKKSRRYEKSTKSSKLNVTNNIDVPVDESKGNQHIKTPAVVTNTITASNEQRKPKRSYGTGKRGGVKNRKNKKIESDQLANINEGDVADSTAEEASLPSNKVVPASDEFAQEVDRTTDTEDNSRTLQSESPTTNTPLHTRISRMAPVVLPRFFSLPAQPVNNPGRKVIQSSLERLVPEQSISEETASENPTKTARDLAREIPQMDRDLKRVNKKQKRIRNRNRNKSGTENAEMDNNSIDITAFDSASPQPATSRPLKKHLSTTLTYDQWKRLPISKRYTPVTFKERLAIHAIESIPEIFAQSTHPSAVSDLPLISRMVSSFVRSMRLARIEAENGVFNSSGQEEKTSIEHVDVMTEFEIKNFISGIQEVVDPDKGGRVVARRYWRLVGLKESERGVGSILTADLGEEKRLGRPSFSLRAQIEGVEGVLLCEAKVDEAGVSLGREWSAE